MMGAWESGLDPRTDANVSSSSQENSEDGPQQHGHFGDQNNPHLLHTGAPQQDGAQIDVLPVTPNRRRRNQQQQQRNQRQQEQRNLYNMQQMTTDLLAAQRERKDKLGNEVQLNRSQLTKLKTELMLLRGRLQPASTVGIFNTERLKEENQRLQIECDFMAREVDLYTNGDIPLGETSEQFYCEINPGQDANELLRNMHLPTNIVKDSNVSPPIPAGRRPTGSRLHPPPRPPPPRFLPIPPQVDTRAGEWFCSVCTFKNHPDLLFCEECNMVRVKPPSSPIAPPSNHP